MLITVIYGVGMVPILAPDTEEPANARLAGEKLGAAKSGRLADRREQAEELRLRNCSLL